ncbi:MAG: beta-N-acetylhexosaminidase [Hyphomicrobiaceae bacterium]
MPKAFILGVAGLELSDGERRLIAESSPAGLILFARNIATAEQVRGLVSAFRSAAGTDRALVLVDQEGGRVQRLKPPVASRLPPAAAYAAHFPGDLQRAQRAAWLVARLVAEELQTLGIDMDCAPVLDVPVPGAHDIIGNRAFAADPVVVTSLGRAFAEGLMAGSVVPVVKHVPGHGRAFADSHLELPVVDAPREVLEQTDLVPFRALSHLPAAMTAHVVYPALDPARPASTSAIVVREIVRGWCGFDGLLMSDDLGMRAMTGTFAERTRAVLEAGSDLALHCSGQLAEMREVAASAPVLAGRSLTRYEAALAIAARTPLNYDREAARSTLAELVARTS